MKTKTQKKLKWEKNENRKQVQIAVESVRGGARCLWKIGIEKKKSLETGMIEWRGDGWQEWWWWCWWGEMIMEVWWIRKRQIKTLLMKWVRQLIACSSSHESVMISYVMMMAEGTGSMTNTGVISKHSLIEVSSTGTLPGVEVTRA